jgi:hypothetical protein
MPIRSLSSDRRSLRPRAGTTKPRAIPVVAIAAFSLAAAAGCGRPELPPEDSMAFLTFEKGKASVAPQSGGLAGELAAQALTLDTEVLTQPQLAAGGSTRNVELAAASVGVVSVAVNLALFWPRAFFAGMFADRAERSGDGWEWKRTYPLAGWSARLFGKVKSSLELEMRVTGLRGEQVKYQEFLWYTGSHESDSGQWVIYELGVGGPVVTIDWQRASATDKRVVFKNVKPGARENGDTLAYALKGRVASMAIHDAADATGAPADFTVEWNTATGEGKMARNATSVCWDTLAQGQVDIPCPAAWPMP